MNLPRHVAIIMDGNGRWAEHRSLSRVIGHVRGVLRLRHIVYESVKIGCEALTVYAFSRENWKRPTDEVSALERLFSRTLDKFLEELHYRGVRLAFIGEHSGFSSAVLEQFSVAQKMTQCNTKLVLNIAMNYSGRWDIVHAMNRLIQDRQKTSTSERISEEQVTKYLALGDLPPPDLLIRSGGERRLSNFLLWQTAYTELYFCDTLWPDFRAHHFREAIAWYAHRERRFGALTNHRGLTHD